MKAIELLIDEELPPAMRGRRYELSSKGLAPILSHVAVNYPDKYPEFAKKISNIGRNASWTQGESIRLQDLFLPIDKDGMLAKMDSEIGEAKKRAVSKQDFEKLREGIWLRWSKIFEDESMRVAKATNNSIGHAVASGSRGKPPQLKMMLGAAGVFTDAKDRTVPLFARNAFNEGLRPYEYLATNYGARKSVVATKRATADGGDFCLAYDTLVRMADGSSKEIRDIIPGEKVLGANTQGNTFPVKVLRVFDQGEKPVYTWVLRGEIGAAIECTEEHKFLTEKGEIVPIGDFPSLYNLAGGAPREILMREYRGAIPCYDIEVDHPDHLFVLANGVICSNSKQLIQAGDDLIVTIPDCKTSNGLEYDVNDPWLKYRPTAKDFGPVKAGTVLDGEAPNILRKAGFKSVVVRSPLTCEAEEGVCSKCMGVDAAKRYPKIGASVGTEAGQAIGEPITQAALNCLVEGTFVRMADMTVKAIETIQVGDKVLGADLDGNTFPSQVTAVWDQGLQPTQRYTYEMGQAKQTITLECTEKHPILSNKKLSGKGYSCGRDKAYRSSVMVPAGRVQSSDVTSLGLKQCWDLSVDSPDELFVLANGLIVHNTKHQGGSAAGAKREYSGFSWLRQFTQVPENFKDAAAVAPAEGKIEDVKAAPQGGSYIRLNGKDIYVLPGFEIRVKPGDAVEAGDILSDGLASPYDVLKARGLGSGRRYYRDRFLKILEDSGQKTDPRNVELATRANVRHVMVKDFGIGDTLPDDVIDYSKLEMEYERPENTVAAKPQHAVGKWLQAPVLHYTTGQRLTARQAKKLESLGYDKVLVSETAPSFEPELPRLRTSSQVNDDWMAGLAGSYLGRRLNDAAIRGQDTNIESNIHYAPRLAYGVDFGKNVETTGKF